MVDQVWGAVLLVLVGAIASSVPALLIERAKGRREQAMDWVTVRRSTYTRFLATLSRTSFQAVMLARRLEGTTPEVDARGRPFVDWVALPPGHVRDAAESFERLRDALTEVYEELRLVAGQPIVDAAKRSLQILHDLTIAARECKGAQTQAFLSARQALSAKEGELRRLMRAELAP